MANIYNNLSDLFTAIANAIKVKKGSTDAIVADNFPSEIRNLKTGFDYNNNEVTAISDYEFYNCTDLKSVDCYSLQSIGVSAFEGCSNLGTVTIYDDIISIGENAFKGCNCIIYSKSTSILENWHTNWNPDGCLVMCDQPTETWDISDTRADSVTAELYAVDDGYVLSIYGRGNMENYSSNEYPWDSYRDSITALVIYNGVTNISHSAFSDCTNLSFVVIPNSIIDIGRYAFRGCPYLTDVTIPDGVVSIGNYAFKGCTSLESVVIPASVTIIDYYTFANCTNLKSVSCAKDSQLTTFASQGAFQDCISLASIEIPKKVTFIGEYTFCRCSKLTNITFDGTVEQWNAIEKGGAWDSNTGNYTIYCTDGTIAKDGTITYYTASEEVTENG